MNEHADRIVAHYEKHARHWDADRQRAEWNDKPWIDRFIAALPEGGTVLDLGCGSGWPVARHLVASGFSVTGVDSSPTQISMCRERLPEPTWIVADMRSLALGKIFNGILAWDSFFHLKPDDQRAMFGVFASHAASGASLAFNAGPAHGEAMGEYRGDPLYHASLSADEYQSLLDAAGFDIVAHVVADREAAGGRNAWLAKTRW